MKITKLITIAALGLLSFSLGARELTDKLCCVKNSSGQLLSTIEDAIDNNNESIELLNTEFDMTLSNVENIIECVALTEICDQIIELNENINEQFDDLEEKLDDKFEQTFSCLDIIKVRVACDIKIPVTQDPDTWTLDIEGRSYILCEDITIDTPLTIIQDNITLDLNKHTIAESSTGQVTISSNNVELFNGTLTSEDTLTTLKVSGNRNFVHDVSIFGSGINNNDENVDISGDLNVFTACNSYDGRRGFNVSGQGNCLTQCSAKNNRDGFIIEGEQNQLLSCIAHNNRADGIELLANSQNNHVRDCTANNNVGFGIENSTTTINHIFNNIALNNTAGAYNSNANANSATEITGPGTISLPGSYILTNDILVPDNSGIGLLITTSNVVLDLNNHTIFGQANSGSGIVFDPNVALQNIEIFNGVIRDIDEFNGIVTNGSSHFIHDIKVDNCPTGISIRSDHTVVQNCFVTSCAFTGIDIEASNNVCCVQCTAKQNRTGIEISGDKATVQECIVVDSTLNGIDISSLANDGYINNNILNHNGGFGICVDPGATDMKIFGNFALNNISGNYDGSVPFDVVPTFSIGRVENIDA